MKTKQLRWPAGRPRDPAAHADARAFAEEEDAVRVVEQFPGQGQDGGVLGVDGQYAAGLILVRVRVRVRVLGFGFSGSGSRVRVAVRGRVSGRSGGGVAEVEIAPSAQRQTGPLGGIGLVRGRPLK